MILGLQKNYHVRVQIKILRFQNNMFTIMSQTRFIYPLCSTAYNYIKTYLEQIVIILWFMS